MGQRDDSDVVQPILIAGDWRAARKPEGDFRASNPTTGALIGSRFPISGADDIEAALAAAVVASQALSTINPEQIATFLERYAGGIEAAAEQLVVIAHAETALPAPTRLTGNELPRTTGQLRQAAAAVRSRSWTNPVIDTKASLRSHLAPLGKPVLVFGPNNFPFAFNAIAGSDFASAIAARNAVIAKAHPSHPATSQLLAQIAHRAACDAGLPSASVQLLYDVSPKLGSKMCADRRLGAIGFTGSRKAGLALKAAADAAGIAMYAEMSSVNPVFFLYGALRERGAELATEVFGSCMLGSGQFCTNPGLLIVPHGNAGDAFVASLSEQFAAATVATVFSASVQRDAVANLATLRKAGANVLASSSGDAGEGFRVAPTLLGIEASNFMDDSERLQTEVFGPISLVIRADALDQMIGIARALDGNLTGSIFTASDGSDDANWQAIASVLRNKVGRLIENKMPTGVSVSSAMQHGGPFPASSHSGFTSVGMPAAIRRFAALQSYDQVSDARLPDELRDANPLGIQRCVDGEW
ncbi:MAG: aldehyde dehydrogenase family protein, partial [Dokdonella sp.]